MFEIKGLTKVYKTTDLTHRYKTAVENVSFSLEKGATLGVIGESGCGKSTLAGMLVGIVKPSSGQIIMDGADVTNLKGEELKQFRKKVQIIFQNPETALDLRMTIRNSICEALRNYNIVPKKSAEETDLLMKLIDTVGLQEDQLDRYPREVSGGQIQRAVLSRIIALQPEVLIADEPTSMLDVSVQAQILDLIKRIQKEYGLSILFISHDLDVVKLMCDEVIVMYRGRVLEYGKTEDVLEYPAHPYTQKLARTFYSTDFDQTGSEDEILYSKKADRTENRSGCLYTECPLKSRQCETIDTLFIPQKGKHQSMCIQSPCCALRTSKVGKSEKT